MDNTSSINDSIWSQFGASLDMLENAINMCPDEAWDSNLNFEFISYHVLLWTDYFLTTDPKRFAPPAPFSLTDFDRDSKPDRTYAKSELLVYLNHCRQKAYHLISKLNWEKLNERWINDYKNYSLLEILLYNLRHIQHHTAQLNLLLRQNIHDAPPWVSQAKKVTE
jgi:hypothetical protein